MDIGGQDSKLILLQDGIVVDFAMNSVCAAGTGSFLEQQANRLNITVQELGERARDSTHPVRIAGRCTVFAESDMIHKQQMGHPVDDIVYGLCQALVRNYLNNLALGKHLHGPVVFQGGVAANAGVVRAFEEALETEIVVPPRHETMGALGAALLARDWIDGRESRFLGFEVALAEYRATSFECGACPNLCEIAQIKTDGRVIARWGGRCERWEVA
jgi:predicted CoA-substrate-specific enzyme activase